MSSAVATSLLRQFQDRTGAIQPIPIHSPNPLRAPMQETAAVKRRPDIRGGMRGAIRQDEFGQAWIYVHYGRVTLVNCYASTADAADAAFALGMIPEETRTMVRASSNRCMACAYDVVLPRGYSVSSLAYAGFEPDIPGERPPASGLVRSMQQRFWQQPKCGHPQQSGAMRHFAHVLHKRMEDLLKLRLKPLHL